MPTQTVDEIIQDHLEHLANINQLSAELFNDLISKLGGDPFVKNETAPGAGDGTRIDVAQHYITTLMVKRMVEEMTGLKS